MIKSRKQKVEIRNQKSPNESALRGVVSAFGFRLSAWPLALCAALVLASGNSVFSATLGITTVGSANYPQVDVGNGTPFNAAGTGDNSGNIYISDPFTLTAPLTATTINTWGSASGSVQITIYSDNSGSPGTALFAAVTYTSTAGAWTTVTIPNTFLAAGNYWVVYNMNNTHANADFISKKTVSGYTRKSRAGNYGTPFPVSGVTWTSLGINNADAIYIGGAEIEGYAKATKATLATTGIISSMNFFSAATGNFRLAIYSDNSGAPGTKQWESGDTAATANTWNTVNISAGTPTSLTLNAGTYWLAWQWNSVNAGPSYALGSANTGDFLTQTYGAFPTTWSGGTLSTENWSLYAIYNTTGPATKLVYTVVPTTGIAGTAFSVTVTSEDASGNPSNPTSATTITLSQASGGGSLSGTLTGTIPTSGSSVTISTPVYSKADTMTLTATATAGEMTLTPVTSGNIVFSPGAVSAGVSTVVASPISVTANGATTSTITVTLMDANGNLVSGKTVTLGKTSGPGTPTITTVQGVTVAGVATFTVKSTTAGADVFTATDTSDTITIAQTATVTFVAGPATQTRVETAADGSGTVVSAQNVIAGNSITVYAISRDAGGNFLGNVSANWSLVNIGNGVVSGDLTPASGTSATFTGHLVGSANIQAMANTFAGQSGLITVIAGAATQMQVETAANGSGTVVPTQNITAGNSISVFAITRDAQGNFVGNPSATWSLQAITGGVVSGDLVGGGASAVFTGHLVGSANIRAVATFTGLSGIQTVVLGPAAQTRVETAADGSGTVVPAQNVAAGNSITVYAISRDAGGNFLANVSATWSLQSIAGGVAAGDLVSGGTSAVFTGHLVGSAKIQAAATFTGQSGTQTVIAGAATQTRVETAADGTGTVVSAQNVTAGNSITVFAISRDAFGNFMANPSATWSLQSITAGVVGGDLVSGGPSAVFTGHVVGSANIQAIAAFTGQSGVISVVAGAPSHLIVTLPGETFTTGVGNSGTPTVQTAGTPFTIVSLTAVDNFNNIVTTVTGGKTIGYSGPGTSPGGNAPSYTTAVTFALGQSTTALATTLFDAQTTTTISATTTGLTGLASSSLTVNPSAATHTQVETAANGSGVIVPLQSVTAGNSITVFAIDRDLYGNFVANPSATWSLQNITAGVVSGDLVGGGPSAVFTGNVVGSAKIQALADFTGQSGTISVVAGAPLQLIVTLPGETFIAGVGNTGSPTAQTAGTAFTIVKLTAVDGFNNIATSFTGATAKTIGYSGPGTSPGGNAPTYTTSVIFTSGQSATALATTLFDAQTTTITPSATGLTGVTSSSLTVNPAANSAYRIAAASGTPTAGANDQLTITLVDKYRNTETGFNGSKTLTFSGLANSPGGNIPTVTDNTGSPINQGTGVPITFAGGVSSLGGLLVPYAVQGPVLLAATDGVLSTSTTGGAGVSLTISAAAASQLAFVQGPNNGSEAVAISPAVAVKATDNYGNPISGVSVTMSLNPVTGTLGGGTAQSTAAGTGIATFNGLIIANSGVGYTLTASSGILPPATSGTFTITGARFSVNPTAWSSTGTWSRSSGGSSGAPVPDAADAVTIERGLNVTEDLSGATAGSMQFASTSSSVTGAGTLTFGTTGNPSLTVAGVVQLGSGVSSSRDGTITFSSTATLTAGSLVFGASGGGQGFVNMTAGGTLILNGAVTVGSGSSSFTAGTGEVQFTANNTLPNSVFTSFHDLTITSGTTALSTAITVGGNLEIDSGAFMNLGAGAFTSTAATLSIANVPQPSLTWGGSTATGVTHQSPSFGTTSKTLSVTIGPPTKLVFTTQPPLNTASGATMGNVVVTEEDSNSHPETSDSSSSVTIAIGNNPSGGTLSGTLTLTLVSGVATFNDLSIDNVGTLYTLTATESGLPVVTSGTFSITKATPTIGGVTGSQSIPYGTGNVTLSGTISSSGPAYPAMGDTVTVSINGNAQTTTINDSTGDFFINYNPSTIPASATAYTITYSFTGAGDPNFNAAANNTSTKLTVNKAPLSVTASAESKTYGQTVTFGGGSMLFTSSGLQNGETIGTVTLAVSGNGGLATAAVGSYTITPSLATGGTFNANNYTTITYNTGTLTVNKAPLSITANPQTKTYGTTLSLGTTAFTKSGLLNSDTVTGVTLTSSGTAANAPVSGSPYSIIPSAAVGSGLGNYTINYINGNLTVNQLSVSLTGTRAADGTATASFSILSVQNKVPGDDVTLASGSANLASANVGSETITSVGTLALGGASAANYTLGGGSGSVTITAGAPAAIVFVQPPTSVQAATSISPAVTVKVTDAFGNPVSGVAVTMSINSGPGGTLSGGGAQTTSASGVATFSALQINLSGTYTLAASVASPSLTVVSSAITVTAGAFAGYTVTASSPQIQGTAFTVTVTAVDAGGNPVNNNSPVTMTSSTADLQFTGSNPVTPVLGTFNISASDIYYETVTITATGGGKNGNTTVTIDPTTVGAYRSVATGNWGDASTWQTWSGSAWVPAAAAPGNSTLVPISVQGGFTVTVLTSVTAQNLTIATGSTVSIANGQTFTVNNGVEYGVISDGTSNNGILVESGAGNVFTLLGNNSYGGGTLISAGTLVVTNVFQGTGIQNLGSGPLTFDTGGTLMDTSVVPAGNVQYFSNIITLNAGGGVLVQTGAAGNTIFLTNTVTGGGGLITGGSDLILNNTGRSPNTNNNIGAITNYSGRLFVNTLGSIKNSSIVEDSGAILDFQIPSTINLTSANPITFASGAGVSTRSSTLNLNTANVTFPSSGTMIFDQDDDASQNINVSGNYPTLTGPLSIQVGSIDSTVGAVTFSGSFSGSFGLTKISTGELILAAANNYTGGTIVSGGHLDGSVNGSLSTRDVFVASGATLEMDTTAAMSSSARLLLNGLSSSQVTLAYTGTESIAGLSFDGGSTYQVAGTYGSTSAATHKLSPPFTTGNSGILSVGSPAITVTAASNTKVYDGTTAAAAIPTITSGTPAAGDTVTLSEVYAAKDAPTETLNPTAVITDSFGINVTGSYAITYVTKSGTITKKTLNYTGVTANSKVYDGTTAATFTGNAAPLTAEAVGIGSSVDGTPYTGDSFSFPIEPYTGTFASANVGSWTVTLSPPLTLSGPQSVDYSVGVSTTALAANITTATPTVTVTVGGPYTYNGLPQGPNSVVTTPASSGAVTFSYVGVSGTTYGPSATKPTSAGSYTATATVAADPNNNTASSSPTAFSILKATPAISGVTSQIITYGTASVTLNGTLSAPGPIYPPSGESVTVTINGVNQSATISGSVGVFSVVFPTATLPVSGSPYTITYAYTSDANFNASANNTSTTLTVNKATPTVTVTVGTYTYNGLPQGPFSVTTSPASSGAVTFSYVGVSGTTYLASSTPPTAVGNYTATASVASDANNNGASSSATAFSITAGGAAQLIVTLPNQTFTSGSGNSGTVINQTAGVAFTITLSAVDSGNNINTTYSGPQTVSYSGPANSPSGQPPVFTTTVTFVNGQASLLATTLYDAQTTSITPSISGLTGVPSASLTVIPAAASQLAFTVQPAPVTVAGVAFAPQPVVAVEDQFGNTVTSGSDPDSTVTISLTLTTGVGALRGTASMPAFGGVASFAGLNIDLVGNDKVLTATATIAAGLRTTTTSPAFAIIPAAASQIVFTTQPSSSTVMNIAFAIQPVVTVEDQFGNTVTSALDPDSTATISLALTTGSGPLVGNTPITAVNGVADFSADGLNISSPGNDKVLTATASLVTAGTVTATTSPAFSILPNAFPIANPATYTRAENTQLLIDVTAFLSTYTSDSSGDAVTLVSVDGWNLVDGASSLPNGNGSTFFYSSSFEGKPHLLFTSPNNNNETIDYVVGDAIFPTSFTAQSTITISAFTATGQATGSIAVDGSAVVTTWAGKPGNTYIVQYTPDILSTAWTDVSPVIIAPSGGVFSFTNSPPAGNAFYQLRQN